MIVAIDPARWPALVAAVEADPAREVAGWIDAGAVHTVGSFGRDGFALGDEALLALMQAGRGPTPPLALFHSHPDGRASLSDADRAGLPFESWPQLVIALRGARAVEAALFAWRGNAPREVARYRRGADGAWT